MPTLRIDEEEQHRLLTSDEANLIVFSLVPAYRERMDSNIAMLERERERLAAEPDFESAAAERTVIAMIEQFKAQRLQAEQLSDKLM